MACSKSIMRYIANPYTLFDRLSNDGIISLMRIYPLKSQKS